MALLPMQLEQFLIGTRLVNAGVARMIAPEAELKDLAAWLRDAAADKSLRDAARAQPARDRAYRFDEAAAQTARRIARDLA
jgi:hypothetical protein